MQTPLLPPLRAPLPLLLLLLLPLACAPGAAQAANPVAARLVGPLLDCQVVVTRSGVDTTTATDQQGVFTLTDGTSAEVFVGRNESLGLTCTDPFSLTRHNATFALYPPTPGVPPYDGATLTASAATTAARGYMSSGSYAGGDSWPDIQGVVDGLYSNLGVRYGPVQATAPPLLLLQPVQASQDAELSVRALAAAMLAAESQLQAYAVLGGCLAGALAPGIGVADINAFLAEQLFTSGAAAAAVANERGTLTGSAFVRDALLAAARSALAMLVPALTSEGISEALSNASLAISSTAEVVAGMAEQTGEQLNAGNRLMAGDYPLTGIDVAAEFVVAAQLTGTHDGACQAVRRAAHGDLAALDAYKAGSLQAQMSAVRVAQDVILASLGLPPAPAPQDTRGAVTMLGPMFQCAGVEEALLGSSGGSFGTDFWGVYSLSQRQLGTLYVESRQGCMDLMTGLPLPFVLSSFSVPSPLLAVNPISMLAEGFLDFQSGQQLQMPASNLQELAYAAVGINLQRYLNVLPLPGVAPSGTVEQLPNKTFVYPQNASYVATPIAIATEAGSAQVAGLFMSALALFMPTAVALLDRDYDAAQYLVVRSTAYAFAARAYAQGGRVELNSSSQVSTIFKDVKNLLSVDSSTLPPETRWLPAPPSPPRPAPPASGKRSLLEERPTPALKAALQQPAASWLSTPSRRGHQALMLPGFGLANRKLNLYTDSNDMDAAIMVAFLSTLVVALLGVGLQWHVPDMLLLMQLTGCR